MVKVKICGITRLEDALLAEQLGANYLGFIFYPSSKRAISPAAAARIIAQLTTAKPVGVFVEASLADIQHTARQLGLWGVQTYGEDIPSIDVPLHLHVCPIASAKDIAKACAWRDNHRKLQILLDTHHPVLRGGVGQPFEWAWLPAQRERLWIAGGITPDNVAEILRYQPAGIDLASGVESAPGQKDPNKLKALFNKIR